MSVSLFATLVSMMLVMNPKRAFLDCGSWLLLGGEGSFSISCSGWECERGGPACPTGAARPPRCGRARRCPAWRPRAPVGDTTADRQNFGKMLLVFGCIGTDLCKKICVCQHFSKSTRFSNWNFWNLTNFCKFCDICSFAEISRKLLFFQTDFFAKILRLQRCKRMQLL